MPPRTRAPVGMVATVAPPAPVKTRPPAAVKAAVVPGSKKSGWAWDMVTRQTARVRERKPWQVEHWDQVH